MVMPVSEKLFEVKISHVAAIVVTGDHQLRLHSTCWIQE